MTSTKNRCTLRGERERGSAPPHIGRGDEVIDPATIQLTTGYRNDTPPLAHANHFRGAALFDGLPPPDDRALRSTWILRGESSTVAPRKRA